MTILYAWTPKRGLTEHTLTLQSLTVHNTLTRRYPGTSQMDGKTVEILSDSDPQAQLVVCHCTVKAHSQWLTGGWTDTHTHVHGHVDSPLKVPETNRAICSTGRQSQGRRREGESSLRMECNCASPLIMTWGENVKEVLVINLFIADNIDHFCCIISHSNLEAK